MVEVADDEAPSLGSGDIGEVGSSSSISDSGDLRPPGIPPGCGVPPLLVVLRSCGEPTLESWYLQLTLAVVKGAGVTPPPLAPPPTPGPGDLLEDVGPDSEVLELDAGAYSECVGAADGVPPPPAPVPLPIILE